eukprot:4539278-Amphidinium_carterae.1
MGVPPDTDMPDQGDVSEEELPKTARALPAPGTPSQREVDEHECSGHALFRTWCRTCVQSRGVTRLASNTGGYPMMQRRRSQ